MGRYSDLIQEAQRTAPGDPFGFGGGQGTGQTGAGGGSTNYETIQTGGPLDIQQEVTDYYKDIMGSPDLGFKDTGLRGKQKRRQETDVERLQNTSMQKFGGRSGVGESLSAQYMAESSPSMEAELGAQQLWYQNMMQQAIRPSHQAVPTSQWQQQALNQSSGGGGGATINYAPSRFDNPYSSDVNQAYEGNTGYGQRKTAQVR